MGYRLVLNNHYLLLFGEQANIQSIFISSVFSEPVVGVRLAWTQRLFRRLVVLLSHFLGVGTLWGVDLSVAGCDFGVQRDVVVQFVLVTVLEGDLLLGESFI